jgi:hypothetical protein
MKRIVYVLGAVCALAGSHLALPGHALAISLVPPPACAMISTNPLTFAIAEDQATETSSCGLPASLAVLPGTVTWDLLEPNPSNPQLPVSDYVDVVSDFPAGPIVLGVTSDTSTPEGGLAIRPITALVQESGPEGSNGALVSFLLTPVPFYVSVTAMRPFLSPQPRSSWEQLSLGFQECVDWRAGALDRTEPPSFSAHRKAAAHLPPIFR